MLICEMLSAEQKSQNIDKLSAELTMLRAKAGFTQEHLAELIGVSRQTYSAIEVKKKRMSWNTYLSLIFVYDNIASTKELIRKLGIFPDDLFNIQ